jgi:hypothetical protein
MDAKATAWRYLRNLREVVLWKVEGLPERDQRMPLTATGTNLLGVVKHLAGVEAEYFGMCLGRPWPEPMASGPTTPSPMPTCGPPPTSRRGR